MKLKKQTKISTVVLTLLLISSTIQPVTAQENEVEPKNDEIIEEKTRKQERDNTYRIISGRNYNINLLDGSNLIYFIPLNYKVEKEEGLGFPGPQQKLQPNEEPASLNIGNIGMAVIGEIGRQDGMYISLFISGVLPSVCHSIKVETKNSQQNGVENNNILIFSGIPQNKLCVTQPTPIEASFVLADKLQNGVPRIIKINYQDYATVLWQNDNLEITKSNLNWKISRISGIIDQKPLNRQWLREWIEGKERKVPQPPPQEKPNRTEPIPPTEPTE